MNYWCRLESKARKRKRVVTAVVPKMKKVPHQGDAFK
jgi:hypothetical protein